MIMSQIIKEINRITYYLICKLFNKNRSNQIIKNVEYVIKTTIIFWIGILWQKIRESLKKLRDKGLLLRPLGLRRILFVRILTFILINTII